MKRSIALCSLGILLTLSVLGVGGCTSRAGTVQGTVTRSNDGAPLAQVRVVVYALGRAEGADRLDIFSKGAILHKLTTDEDGTYSVSLPPSNYLIEIWVEGVELASRPIEVRARRTTTAEFSVEVPEP